MHHNAKIDVDKLKELYLSGSSIADMVQYFQVSKGGLYYRLKRQDWYNTGRGRSKNSVEEVKELYLKGVSLDSIAKELNLHRSTVFRILEESPWYKTNVCNNMVGRKFGMLLVIKKNGNGPATKSTFRCKCDCNKSCNKKYTYLMCGNRNSKSCGCEGRPKHKGCGEISRGQYSRINISARVRNLEFNVSIKYIWNLFLKQNRKCALTGLQLAFAPNQLQSGLTTASLDRIDSTKGYIKDNVQWVHKDVNRMKNNFPEVRFIDYCVQIAENKVYKF